MKSKKSTHFPSSGNSQEPSSPLFLLSQIPHPHLILHPFPLPKPPNFRLPFAMNADPDPNDISASKGYALSGKIMLSAMVILFFIVLVMVVLHLYARWYLLRIRRRQILRRARHRRTVLLNPSGTGTVTVLSHGLDPSVLRLLPIFNFTAKTPESLECSVCLSEFEDNETGRLLPKCNHSFHIDCIDMWFESHSTCPLCRSPVESGSVVEKSGEVIISVDEPAAGIEPGTNFELCRECQHEEEQPGTSSFGTRRKPSEFTGVSIEVPKREDESGFHDSPTSQAFRSPMSRMLSLKRILGRDRRGNVSPSAESDAERGNELTRQTQSGLGG